MLVKIGDEVANIMKQVTNQRYKKIVNNKHEVGECSVWRGYTQSAMLWYRTFKECLEELGFQQNKYDPCISNMMIDDR